MSSRIEQAINDIEEYISDCKYQPLSSTKIVVNKEEIEELYHRNYTFGVVFLILILIWIGMLVYDDFIRKPKPDEQKENDAK